MLYLKRKEKQGRPCLCGRVWHFGTVTSVFHIKMTGWENEQWAHLALCRHTASALGEPGRPAPGQWVTPRQKCPRSAWPRCLGHRGHALASRGYPWDVRTCMPTSSTFSCRSTCVRCCLYQQIPNYHSSNWHRLHNMCSLYMRHSGGCCELIFCPIIVECCLQVTYWEWRKVSFCRFCFFT